MRLDKNLQTATVKAVKRTAKAMSSADGAPDNRLTRVAAGLKWNHIVFWHVFKRVRLKGVF
jgi:hypothetical protein